MTVAVAPSPVTTLTAFFRLCQTDAAAKHLLYTNIPSYYTWDQHENSWVGLKRGTQITLHGEEMFETPAIGRVYNVRPKQGDCFFHAAPSDSFNSKGVAYLR
ncbi:hypothetical protein ElyMa_005700000 [Elysia marginata]|uniref:Uncharacterized protein n=1 Tax=Elysia marginata TaxID=1093978 RepID=A0AAV4FIL7_9GAST|nr:hypothetical protein ElyMa_005700000 [Elysia marginata]